MATTHAIRFRCKCGHIMKTSLKHAGQKTRCPKCQGKVRVPVPSPRKSESRKVNTSQQEESLDLGAFMLDASVDDGGEVMALDDFSLDEPVESDSGYDLADEDDADPAWMQHADNAPPIPQSTQGKIPTRGDSPSIWRPITSDVWCSISSGGIALIWVAFILSAALDIDIFAMLSDSEYDTPSDKATPKGLLIAALITTAILGPFFAIRYRRTWGLLSRGVRVPCMILKQGKFAKNEMVDVTFQYSVDGKTYKPKMSVSITQIDTITHLLIDPDKPKRCMIE